MICIICMICDCMYAPVIYMYSMSVWYMNMYALYMHDVNISYI